MVFLIFQFWIIYLFQSQGQGVIHSYGVEKVPLVTASASVPVMFTKGRSILECSILCAIHTSCIQTTFNKTLQTCTGYSRKQLTIGSTVISSYEISCKSPGYLRRTDSSLCIKIILDPTTSSWRHAFNRCQAEGPDIFPIDVSDEHEFIHFQSYLLKEYVPYSGIQHAGTVVGLFRKTDTSPWTSLITGKEYDSSHWNAIVDNNKLLCLIFFDYPGPTFLLDDTGCDALMTPGTLQPVICQEEIRLQREY